MASVRVARNQVQFLPNSKRCPWATSAACDSISKARLSHACVSAWMRGAPVGQVKCRTPARRLESAAFLMRQMKRRLGGFQPALRQLKDGGVIDAPFRGPEFERGLEHSKTVNSAAAEID